MKDYFANLNNLKINPINDQYTVIETVTPQKAKKYLEKTNGNVGRYKTLYIESVVESYARQMASGEWRLTHQGIAFDVNGLLVDGYNRLNAIIRSGANIQLVVTYNMSEEAVKYLDSGKLRSNSDKLRIPKRLAQSLRFAAKHGFKQSVPSTADLEKILNLRYGQTLRKIIDLTPTNYRLITASPVVCGVAYCAVAADESYAIDQYLNLYSQNYGEMTPIVEAFAKQVNRGQFSATDHDDLLARTVYVFSPANSKKTQTGRFNERLVKSMFFNLFSEGKE